MDHKALFKSNNVKKGWILIFYYNDWNKITNFPEFQLYTFILDKNQKPTANAGPDLEFELPRNVIYINGSASKDDWAIVKWKWTRDEKSLALGNIAENSDQSPVLIISDVAVGKYILNLTVFDEQGLSDTDSVTINVKHDPKLFYLIESTIDIYANYLTEVQYEILKRKLALLVSNEHKMIVSIWSH